MKTYHKIKTLWKRENKKPHNMIIGEYAEPEFAFLKNCDWEATEKVDGTNIRIMWNGNKVSFGGKTDNANIPAPLMNKLIDMFGGEANEQKFEEIFGDSMVCLYGEGFGTKIQKGGGNYGEVNFVLFDVWIEDLWLKRSDIEDIAKKLDIMVVPIVANGSLGLLSELVEKGFKSEWGDFMAEGIIAKPYVDLKTRRGDRIITKLKHKDFLKLKE